jgi:hypothetical protein
MRLEEPIMTTAGGEVTSLAAGDQANACWTDPADRAVIATVDALRQRADLDDAEWRTPLDGGRGRRGRPASALRPVTSDAHQGLTVTL